MAFESACPETDVVLGRLLYNPLKLLSFLQHVTSRNKLTKVVASSCVLVSSGAKIAKRPRRDHDRDLVGSCFAVSPHTSANTKNERWKTPKPSSMK